MRRLFYSIFAVFFVVSATGFAQDPVLVGSFDFDEQGSRVAEHAVGLLWAEEDAGGGEGSVSFLIDPSQPDDDSPEGKFEFDLPEGVNLGDYEYVSFYYKCPDEAYTGSNIFMMPMLPAGAAGGGRHHTGQMVGNDQWQYQEFHQSEFSLWWGDWTWEASRVIVIGFTETNDRGPTEIWIDHIVLSNNEGDGLILAAEGPPEVLTTSPAQGAQVSKLSQVQISFNQEVQGVAADGSDLTVNGSPATSVETSNNRNFTFTGFTEPEVGPIEIALQAGAIESVNGDAFAGLSYTITRYQVKSVDAPFATVAPTMDGVIDAGEYAGDWVNDWKDNLGAQDPESESDWNAEWTVTHDADYVYVAFQAADDVRETAANPWEQDNVEMFIDAPNAKSGAGLQFRANWDGSEWVSSANGDWDFTAGDTGDGWVIEARFSKDTLGIPADGVIGFNIQPSDNDDGTRGTYQFWEDSPTNNNPWDTAAAWGNVVLEAASTNVSDWNLF